MLLRVDWLRWGVVQRCPLLWRRVPKLVPSKITHDVRIVNFYSCVPIALVVITAKTILTFANQRNRMMLGNFFFGRHPKRKDGH